MPEHKKSAVLESLGEAYQVMAPYGSVGWVFAVSVVVSMALGWWLDRRVNTKPLFTLCGAVLGIGTGIYNLIVVARGVSGKGERDTGEEKDPG